MKVRDLISLVASRGNIEVEFAPGARDLEVYAEPSMRATVITAEDDNDGVVKLRVSYAKYEAYNEPFETHNYYGVMSNGQDVYSPSYSARETGWYGVEEDVYLMGDDDVSAYLTILDYNELFEMWNAGQKDASYVAWLEQEVTTLKRQVAAFVQDKLTS